MTNVLCDCSKEYSSYIQVVAGENEHDRMTIYSKLCNITEGKEIE
jgi:hypothetical protein